MNIKNYLKPIYGVDTTLLNLYVLDSEKGSFIPQNIIVRLFGEFN